MMAQEVGRHTDEFHQGSDALCLENSENLCIVKEKFVEKKKLGAAFLSVRSVDAFLFWKVLPRLSRAWRSQPNTFCSTVAMTAQNLHLTLDLRGFCICCSIPRLGELHAQSTYAAVSADAILNLLIRSAHNFFCIRLPRSLQM